MFKNQWAPRCEQDPCDQWDPCAINYSFNSCYSCSTNKPRKSFLNTNRTNNTNIFCSRGSYSVFLTHTDLTNLVRSVALTVFWTRITRITRIILLSQILYKRFVRFVLFVFKNLVVKNPWDPCAINIRLIRVIRVQKSRCKESVRSVCNKLFV